MLAGGLDSLERFKDRLKRPKAVIDLGRIESLSGVKEAAGGLVIGPMSPLQFQKSLRLHEARRLMLADHLDAASAAFQVGYESHSQFNREYSRLFGAPPLRDIKGLRQQVTQHT